MDTHKLPMMRKKAWRSQSNCNYGLSLVCKLLELVLRARKATSNYRLSRSAECWQPRPATNFFKNRTNGKARIFLVLVLLLIKKLLPILFSESRVSESAVLGALQKSHPAAPWVLSPYTRTKTHRSAADRWPFILYNRRLFLAFLTFN